MAHEMRFTRLVPAVCLIALGTLIAVAADDPAQPTDPDLAVQGEYVGDVKTDDGPKQYGVQIIARGKGKFEAVGYAGGLPGAGWDKSKVRKATGETKDGITKFVGDEATATVQNGVLTISDGGGNPIGQLKRVVRESPTAGAKAPEGAVILFDGTSAGAFLKGRVTDDHLLMQGVTSKQKFQNFTLHLEFRTPFEPLASGQGRGNSGCYLQGRYEVQVLDSFGLEGKNNECGGIYETKNPDLNMCFPPLTWQTYDIDYTAAVYEDGKKTKNARVTVRHNGVVVHDDVELPKPTRAHPVPEGPEPGPIYLQDHGNQVRYRNIWLVEKP